ncbi:MAG TPA: amino acid ABC transporter substrate-binding protein [Rhodopila sp.]|nr:amino acid ABC transporter substrate-binding protein [Rhodopila sp.]
MKISAKHPGLAWLFVGVAVIMTLAAAAPDPETEHPASETLARIAASRTVTIGIRNDARPFAYQLPDGAPGGFAVDLCRDLVDDISAAVGIAELKIDYQPVTTENRIEKVVSGAVDMECGSTTRTAERERLVAFSPIFYVSGVKLMVARNSEIRSYRDLSDKTVAVTAGTTGEAVMHVLADRLLVRMKFVTLPNNGRSFAALQEGKADAFATDEILLAGLAASRVGHGDFVVGDYLSYEPYGLIYQRNDPAFDAVIKAGFRRLAAQRKLAAIYHRWLLEKLPGGAEALDVPMSAELTQMYRTLGQPD